MRSENEAGSIFGTWLDVTDRRQLERRLEAAQRLESLGLLAAGVAHDFNNVLAAVCGNLEVMERQTTPESALHRAALTAQRAARRGENLVQQLLSFGRQRALSREVLDLARIIGDLSELLPGLLRGQVTLDVALADDLWPIEVDPGELELAILNIVANARDAMSEGGVLRIAAANVTLAPEPSGSRPAGDFVALDFQDTGGGIVPEVLERVFEPFVTTKTDGSGLGLSQVYGFAQQAGGAAVIDSRAGEGTRVTLHLPRAAVAPRGV